jgi:hypothetical protein
MSMIGVNLWIHNIIQYLHLVLIYEINSKRCTTRKLKMFRTTWRVSCHHVIKCNVLIRYFGFRTVCYICPHRTHDIYRWYDWYSLFIKTCWICGVRTGWLFCISFMKLWSTNITCQGDRTVHYGQNCVFNLILENLEIEHYIFRRRILFLI